MNADTIILLNFHCQWAKLYEYLKLGGRLKKKANQRTNEEWRRPLVKKISPNATDLFDSVQV